ncbi:MAG: O-antigen ligase family protein [Candidatus Contendobacter sp.]|nr:O-antigen ligase family protein [Candidatus Contendobacter sp.]
MQPTTSTTTLPLPEQTADQPHPLARPILALLVILLIAAPLFRGGATPLASLALQMLALLILTAALWHPHALPLTRLELGLVLALPLTVLAYLIPLPTAAVNALPGHALQASVEALLPAGVLDAWKPLSINPTATLNAGLALLVPLAVFVGCRALDGRALLRLAQLLLLVACGQALLGLIQYATAQHGEMLFAVSDGHRDSGIGTYANRNHLAGLLVMALALALALLFSSLGLKDRGPRQSGDWRRRAAFLGSRHGGAALAYAAIAVLLVLGIIFSRSRAGISLAMLGLVLSALLYSRRIGDRNAFGLTGRLVAVVIGLGLAIGLVPVLERFSVRGVVEDGRQAIFTATLTGIGQRLPLGSGPGTFADAIRPLQPPGEFSAKFLNRAHNDYLEWVSDAGLIAVVLIVLALLLYLRQWPRVYRRIEWNRVRFLRAGAGVGLLLLALHEGVDYNLCIPANQAVFALLAGLFFMPADPADNAPAAPGRRRRRTPDLDPATGLASPTPASRFQPAVAPSDGQIDNPFRD